MPGAPAGPEGRKIWAENFKSISGSGISGDSLSSTQTSILQDDRYSHAIHYMACSSTGIPCAASASGIKEMIVNISTRRPALDSDKIGNGWNDYHYFNKVQLLHPGKK
jgi:hypothetical protein